MASNGGKTAMARSRRNRLWLLAVCAGLVVGQPGVATSQTTGGPFGVTQLDASLREPVCQLLRSLQGTFADLPGVAGIFTSLLQSFGCSDAPTPGTTTTTAVFPTTTMAPGTTTTTMDGTTTTTAPTSSTTLPPCIPDNPVTTTVPCVPTTSTTAPTGGTTTTAPTGVTTTTMMH
ncbi:MAG: hypothetical protein M3450_19975 [Actinomycetota bacterium]|nr:hypothetical protein [Actinomycetota bacterium]